LEGSTFDSGEDVLAHADAMVQMLAQMGDSQDMQAACYLVYACDHLAKPEEVISKAFGESFATLAIETSRFDSHSKASTVVCQCGSTARPRC